jgi:hypothetical protein
VNAIKVEIVKWLADEPIPGWVEARFTDARGKVRVFFDKPDIFTAQPVVRSTRFPVPGKIQCEVVDRSPDADSATISVRTFEADSDGEDLFEVKPDQIANSG